MYSLVTAVHLKIKFKHFNKRMGSGWEKTAVEQNGDAHPKKTRNIMSKHKVIYMVSEVSGGKETEKKTATDAKRDVQNDKKKKDDSEGQWPRKYSKDVSLLKGREKENKENKGTEEQRKRW